MNRLKFVWRSGLRTIGITYTYSELSPGPYLLISFWFKELGIVYVKKAKLS